MTTEVKTFRFTDMQVKADGNNGTLEGYGSSFGGVPDSYGDIVAKGAFADSIAKTMPKMLYQHDSGKLAGVWDSVQEDNHGLYLKGRFINTSLSQQAREECSAGALDSMSIGFVHARRRLRSKNGHPHTEESCAPRGIASDIPGKPERDNQRRQGAPHHYQRIRGPASG